MGSLGNVTHVIFDLDGLILNTEILYDVAIQKILDRFDKTYTYDLKMKVMGMKYHKSMDLIQKELDIPITAEELVTESMCNLKELFIKCDKMPGAERLINHLRKHGIPMCIATGSSSKDFELKTHSHKDLVGMMEFTVRSDDPEVKHGKPHPDIFLVAKSRFQTPPASSANCLVLEDAPNGVKAAMAADMKCVMVPDPRLETIPPAHLVLKSLEEFSPQDFGLPPF
ncbi:hypothetical protein ACHWQZ_G007403 [Mnemiopsis leidyi]